jgi:myo-inositol-1(or 4)-monophosphatase
MTSWHPPAILAALQAAGRLALRHYESPELQLKADGSVVTQADREVEALLTARLAPPGGPCRLLGEETFEQQPPGFLAQALAGELYILDPIDGTACYARHLPLWGVSLGYASAGVLREGAIYLPVLQEVFYSDGPEVWWGRLDPAAPDATPTDLRRVPPASPADPAGGMLAITQGVLRHYRFSDELVLHALATAVVPLTYLLLGRYVGYLGQVKLWDLAGGLPLLLKAGFTATLTGGTPLTAAITPTAYTLDAADPHCWLLRQPCLFAPPGADRWFARCAQPR